MAMRELARPAAIGVAALALASCGAGLQAAAGPVVGYVKGRGASFGWEAGGGPMKTVERNYRTELAGPSLIARINLGMSWRPAARELVGYAAWEPWRLLGGTLGATYSWPDRQVGGLGGVWGGAAWIGDGCSPCYTVTVALGWRWARGSEVYLTPKLGILNGIGKPWPYSSGSD